VGFKASEIETEAEAPFGAPPLQKKVTTSASDNGEKERKDAMAQLR